MPTLDWIGKKAVVGHHNEVPFHLLQADDALSAGDPHAGNLLVEGDNLLALKALLPHYAGQVKCIYIDPPYNTGNENWVYNDNVNSPEMRAWLGKVVGTTSEDLSRHDKWLCMMYPRLRILRDFLRDDGAIFVSIDDNEAANLKLLLDELFGPRNLVTMIAWQKRVSPANDAKYFSSDHEYLAIYARDKNLWRPNRLPRTEKQEANYRNPDNDPRGPWNSATYTCNKTVEERPNLYYGIAHPATGELLFPKKTAVWKYEYETYLEHAQDNRLFWGIEGTNRTPRVKTFLSEVGQVVPRSIWSYADCGHTQEARSEILRILGDNPFTTPKPVRLIRRILEIGSSPGDLVLDSFAGSGTTGHAVLATNTESATPRHFILVELESHIARNVTAERLKRVVAGYEFADHRGTEKKVPGLGGGFRYCTLGTPLFDANHQINKGISFADLARHVFFAETGLPLSASATDHCPLVGVVNGTAVYLLYNGVLKDKRPRGGNVLTADVAATLPAHDGPKVIYGTACRLGNTRLSRAGITFRQIPYQVKVS